MTSNHQAVREAAADDEITEITEDMILELEAAPPRGKLLHFPPPLPRAVEVAGPVPQVLRRRRGLFRIIVGD